MNQEKLYGIYPGSLNINLQNIIYKLSEEETYKLIYTIEDEIFWSEHEDRNYITDDNEINEKMYALDYVIYSTRRFGINFSNPTTKRLEKNINYINWYNNLNNFFFNNKTLIKK